MDVLRQRVKQLEEELTKHNVVGVKPVVTWLRSTSKIIEVQITIWWNSIATTIDPTNLMRAFLIINSQSTYNASAIYELRLLIIVDHN